MTKKEREKQRQESIEYLRTLLKPGDTVYTHVNSVARSGMSRHMDLFLARQEPNYNDGKPYILRITWDVAMALGWAYDKKQEDLRVNGCGMDMCFHTVYELAYVLFKDEPGDRDKGYSLNKQNI